MTAATRRINRRRKPAKAPERRSRAASRGERAQAGKAAREAAPRSSHAEWAPSADRRDPTAVLLEQAEDRVPELVPIRHGRMSTTPFAFYRGGAAVMAGDLATTPSSGLRVQLCGDAHMSNFGGFASPERELLFDLNDFDETLPGPWEWDVKRLLASVAIAGRERGVTAKTRGAMLRAAAAQYRMAMRSFAGAPPLEVWYARMDASDLVAFAEKRQGDLSKRVDRTAAKARTKDSMRALAKLTRRVDGRVRIAADPPLIVPVEDFLPDAAAHELEDWIRELLVEYRSTVPVDRRRLLDRFDYGHLARKVVGVGSVGTRAWIVLVLGRDGDEPLFLQAKEAQASVLEPYAGASEFDNAGRRVVEGQRLMQAASDILLGWLRVNAPDGVERDFYVRQLWDWKASADVAIMAADAMAPYARACAWTLARAHARSGDAVAIGAYLGSGDTFDRAVAEFAESYADQNERDFRAFVEAIDAGRLAAESGL